jgi:hypothetical protein
MAPKRTQQQRHVVAVSQEEWDEAQRIGESQPIPVSASTVLRTAIKFFLEQKRQESQGKSGAKRDKQ